MMLSCSKTCSGSLVLLENELEDAQLGIGSCRRSWILAVSWLLRPSQLMPRDVLPSRAGTIFMSELQPFRPSSTHGSSVPVASSFPSLAVSFSTHRGRCSVLTLSSHIPPLWFQLERRGPPSFDLWCLKTCGQNSVFDQSCFCLFLP